MTRLNSRLRDELLNRQLFSGLREARVIPGQHRRWSNKGRNHSGIGYMTPKDYEHHTNRLPQRRDGQLRGKKLYFELVRKRTLAAVACGGRPSHRSRNLCRTA
ncbi:MAG: transposase [Planctomycetes bacterium]|nr:transposase [Planctomycetota bacterium]